MTDAVKVPSLRQPSLAPVSPTIRTKGPGASRESVCLSSKGEEADAPGSSGVHRQISPASTCPVMVDALQRLAAVRPLAPAHYVVSRIDTPGGLT